jgi:hypothetical protein
MRRHHHIRPQHPLLAVLVLLGALSLSTDVAAQQPSIQQANAPQTTVVSTTNTGTGSTSQTTTQVVQNQSSISQSQTTVATGGQSQIATQPRTSAVTPATAAVALATGCSNIVLSWPLGTSLADVAAAVTPTNALTAIFKLDAARGRYRGYMPTAPAFANDYIAVEAALEAVFVCVNQSANLARPSS